MVLGNKLAPRETLIVAGIIFISSPAVSGPLHSGIVIPENTHRFELAQDIPLTKEKYPKLARVVIREKTGQCHMTIGGLPEVNLEMPLPCDIQTEGAAFAFRPVVGFQKNSSGPDDISFLIAGNLKYYPTIRSECSQLSRGITIKWKAGKNGRIEPHIVLSEIIDDYSNTRCPRAFVEVKGPTIYGLDPSTNP